MTIAQYEAYITALDDVENRIIDDTKFPIVKDSKVKTCCYATLELLKLSLNYLKVNINNASTKKQ